MTSLAKPDDVVNEIYDTDEGVRKQFQNAVAAETIAFAEAFAPAYAAFDTMRHACNGSMQRELAIAFLHGLLDDLLTSVKLLLSGKLGASGNLVRQGVESLCMAILCAHDGPLVLGREKKEYAYWKLIEGEDPLAEGNRAPYQVEANADRLQLSENAAAQLKETVATHHAHSHAGRVAIANRIDLGKGGNIHFGGHFDSEKLEGYKLELQQRGGLCKVAHETITELSDRLKKLPVDTPSGS